MTASSRRGHFSFLTNLLSTIHYSQKCMNPKNFCKVTNKIAYIKIKSIILIFFIYV